MILDYLFVGKLCYLHLLKIVKRFFEWDKCIYYCTTG